MHSSSLLLLASDKFIYRYLQTTSLKIYKDPDYYKTSEYQTFSNLPPTCFFVKQIFHHLRSRSDCKSGRSWSITLVHEIHAIHSFLCV